MFFIIIFVYLPFNIILCVGQPLNLTEGSPCTWVNYNGTCTNRHKCLLYLVDKTNGEHSPICSVQDDVPIICCTECPSLHVEDVDNIIFNENVGLLYKNGMKYWDACVDYVDKLPYHMKASWHQTINKYWNTTVMCHQITGVWISPVGGQDTNRGEYPFMALLGYGSDMESAQWLCGGSLISDRFILTAAHCISSPLAGPVKFIALGVWKRSDPNELWQRYNVKTIIPHPEYKSPAKYHDIALLETDKPVEFNPGCLPACLHSGKDIADLHPTYALGWGSLGPGKHLADILQQVYLQSFNDEECSALYKPHRLLKHGYNSSIQMCYGDHDEPKDTCMGDSGGPLIGRCEVSSAGFTIIGVTSYGVKCGVAPSAGMYTRVSHYVPWIESIVWP